MFSTITKLMAGDDGKEVTMENARNVAQQTDTSKVLVGKCFLSIRRLVQGQKKRRTYMLGTLNEKKWNGSLFDVFDSPEGVAGSITMEIESDTLGEPASEFRLNDSLESEMSSRLLRLLLSYDPPRVAVLDLILANVYDTSESVSKQGSTPSRRARPNNMVEVAVGPNQLHFTEPTVTETFEQLLTRWCQKYGGGPQLQPFRAQITVDGCTNLDTKLWKTKVFGSNEVYVVLRTEMESFVTGAQKLDETVVWSQGNQVTFTVPNPLTTMLLVVLYGESGSRRFEIGRCQLSFVALAREHTSLRNMFLLNGASVMISEVNAMIRLTMKPLNFGMTSMNQIDYVDEFYDRMNKFLRRYNPYALPQVDTFIRSRLNNLEDYMQELVVQHGREPGSAKIVLTLEAIYSLLADCDTELDGHDIQVIVTFGNVEMKSKVYGVRRYAGVKIGEVFQFDVVRETDMMRIDVIRASNPNMVYGRVDFTCLDIQKGVRE
ncbi:hypothetical protein AGDE_15158 [Angomonas deanei]|uniref:Uncharacterized protein n=1 Tax=Angomonas deanei TaxID=59799 RepID=A0A7G2C2R6_9TRYP|nr:hypothetical protein AGDE_15158 [Angomonas deanei]CAD2212987.1 hypothetical protein, conserved [Angomonas deanei]|eukprot:EPY19593.1 hypothetical protein AGDE_15158 [Angomonas deanei]